MTPRHLYALRKRQIQRFQREELLMGILASTSANFSMHAPKKPLSPEDFMLHKFAHQPPKKLTAQDIMSAFAPFRKKPIVYR